MRFVMRFELEKLNGNLDANSTEQINYSGLWLSVYNVLMDCRKNIDNTSDAHFGISVSHLTSVRTT